MKYETRNYVFCRFDLCVLYWNFDFWDKSNSGLYSGLKKESVKKQRRFFRPGLREISMQNRNASGLDGIIIFEALAIFGMRF